MELAEKIYQQAIDLATDSVGMADWRFKVEKTFHGNVEDMIRANRMDAEYHQPEHELLRDRILENESGCARLCEIVNIIKAKEKIVPRPDFVSDGVPYIRGGDITRFGVTIGAAISKDASREYRHFNFMGNRELLIIADGVRPGEAVYVDFPPFDMVLSPQITRLIPIPIEKRKWVIDNRCLAVMLNSPVVRCQVRRMVRGSLILHWNRGDIGDTLIPIPPIESQDSISRLHDEAVATWKT